MVVDRPIPRPVDHRRRRHCRLLPAHFRFEPTFEADWYVSLRSDRWELAVLDSRHETTQAAYRGPVAGGMLINLEVD
ncbi:MAG: hypothetical protein ABW022_02265, partial [Actinoplanes sp.]